jgi:4-amino-4-deoxy-L-arabinose transferase-like glycosyltransferase
MTTAALKQEAPGLKSPLLACAGSLMPALIIGWIGLFWTTRFGLGLTNDSPSYTMPVREALAGREFIIIHHPPLFPALIYVVAASGGIAVMKAALVVQFAALTLLITAVWCQLYWSLKNVLAAGIGSVCLAVCFPITEIAGWVGDDLLGTAWTVWTLAFLYRYLQNPETRCWLWTAMLGGALALLTRFAGFAVVWTVSMVVWFSRGKPWGQDFFRALGAGVIMCLPCGLHLLANSVAYGHATDRTLTWNGLQWDRVRQALETVACWHLPTLVATWPTGLLLVIMVTAFLIRTHRAKPKNTNLELLLIIYAAFFALSLVFYLAVIGASDFGLALDNRTLLPLVPCSIVFATIVAAEIWRIRPGLRFILIAFFALYLGFSWRRSASLYAAYGVLGRGQCAPTYTQSNLGNFLRAHKEKIFITNNPSFLYNLTGQEAIPFPVTRSLLTNKTQDVTAETTALQKLAINRPGALFVVFDISDNEFRLSWPAVAGHNIVTRCFNDYFVSVYTIKPPSL